ncbi:alpha/beta fold hydrolase [Nonomuraea bangladeshensis]|uniref:alpha/beta fold hydrolase n=1 Tax=Nonomuraea bangladeshensis TaxID=404385 RepID=UPI003C2CF7D0
MPTFAAHDGTTLAYHVHGSGGRPLVCLPGGPQASAYLGDLGGLSAHRRVITLDLRGTGDSATPADAATYRCDRQAEDVEALRAHLGEDRLDLLGHCGGANLAVRYAARHPARIARLVLITPSTRAVGVDIAGEARREVARSRAAEPWFAEAYAALERITAGEGRPGDGSLIAPFTYGRWDAPARAHHADGERRLSREAAAGFGAEGAFDPAATRAALKALDAPVLVLAGEVDVAGPPAAMSEVAGLFPRAELVVQPSAGHFPWLDDPVWFAGTLRNWLDQTALDQTVR